VLLVVALLIELLKAEEQLSDDYLAKTGSYREVERLEIFDVVLLILRVVLHLLEEIKHHFFVSKVVLFLNLG